MFQKAVETAERCGVGIYYGWDAYTEKVSSPTGHEGWLFMRQVVVSLQNTFKRSSIITLKRGNPHIPPQGRGEVMGVREYKDIGLSALVAMNGYTESSAFCANY